MGPDSDTAGPPAVGGPVQDNGTLSHRAPSIDLSLDPPERRGRQARTYRVILTNPTATPITARLSAVDRSGNLEVLLKKESVVVPPTSQGAIHVSLKVAPWTRTHGSGAQTLTFGVAATPIDPPGDATTVEGRFVALPSRSIWLWAVLLLLVVTILLLSPLYEEAFYLAGWNEGVPNDEHHFIDDVECAWDAVTDGGPGQIRGECFEKGVRPTEVPPGMTG